MEWEWKGEGGRDWRRLEAPEEGSEHGVSIPAESFYSNGAAEACLVETHCTAACSAHTADSEIKGKLHLFQCFPPGQRKFGI